jgi:hypothetical protein
MLAAAACSGRTRLVPMHQIGRLSDDAVVASDAGVRVVIRTAAWTGNPAVRAHVVPIEVTFDNGSTRALAIARENLAFLTEEEQRLLPLAPGDISNAEASAFTADMIERALPEGTLAAGDRVSGFIYFPPIENADEVRFRAELQDAVTGERVGVIEVPFHLE